MGGLHIPPPRATHVREVVSMPTVIVRYNDSPDCVLIHHGVAPHRRRDRIELMKPLAEEAVAELKERCPGIEFELRPDELEGPVLLLWADLPKGLPKEDADSIVAVTNRINTDFTRMIDPYPCVVEALPAEDRETLRRLSGIGLRETVPIVKGVDECLSMLDASVSLAEMDVLIRIYTYTYPKTYQRLSTGRITPIPSSDGNSLIGFRFAIGTPATLGLIAHETAHVLESMHGHWQTDKHDETYVSYLSQLLRMMVTSGCEERVRAVAGPTDLADMSPCGACPGLVEDVRWRMSTGKGSAYVLWCGGGISLWGVGSRDHEGFLSGLDDKERAFVELALGKHASD